VPDSINFRFDHIHINCTDVASSERWFVEGMGAKVTERYDSFGVAITHVDFAGLTILLRPARPGEQLTVGPSPRFGDDHFGVVVDDLDEAATELKKRGVIFDMEPRDFGPRLRISFVRGPDNVRIELMERK
jgi:lactoylglutathione lyase